MAEGTADDELAARLRGSYDRLWPELHHLRGMELPLARWVKVGADEARRLEADVEAAHPCPATARLGTAPRLNGRMEVIGCWRPDGHDGPHSTRPHHPHQRYSGLVATWWRDHRGPTPEWCWQWPAGPPAPYHPRHGIGDPDWSEHPG